MQVPFRESSAATSAHHVGLARRDVDLGAGIDEALGDHLADAAAAPGDECGLAGNVEEIRGGHRSIVPVAVTARPMPGAAHQDAGPDPEGLVLDQEGRAVVRRRSSRPPRRRRRRSSSPAGGAGTR